MCLMLLIILVNIEAVNGQPYLPGVEAGDRFDYKVTYKCGPDFGGIPLWKLANQSEWMSIIVESVNDSVVDYYVSMHFSNGSDYNLPSAYCDVALGYCETYEVGALLFPFFPANHDSSEQLPGDWGYFNGSYIETYPEGDREINYISEEQTFYGPEHIEMHFDKQLGVLTYVYDNLKKPDGSFRYELDQTLIASNVFVVPEFGWAIMPLFLTVALLVFLFQKTGACPQ